MRIEIMKFRAWEISDNTMSFWTMNDLCAWDDEKTEKPSALNEWMQYTGLKDKNGKEIYEGDVMALKTKGGNNLYIIIRDEEVAGFDWKPANKDTWGDNFSGFLDEYEVIGNIYENPELIK